MLREWAYFLPWEFSAVKLSSRRRVREMPAPVQTVECLVPVACARIRVPTVALGVCYGIVVEKQQNKITGG